MDNHSLIDMINDLNRICKQSFGIGYSCGWEVYSYREGTPFGPGHWVYGGESFEDVVTEAHNRAVAWEERQNIQNSLMTA